ncbi:hypothetical protein FocTR4_00016523 [Fusarium oxysporum f. sp. cubense]|uniref:Uncharacterized protein n=1 Tax=Fusarium oxysporum f. sp. cubense TaxID=61366 RepID=A0A5C6SBZ8_FUSOC|nr:hypothetical protein FocTR4_00016523 [Fusarium oxysporum f. sp. cubense]
MISNVFAATSGKRMGRLLISLERLASKARPSHSLPSSRETGRFFSKQGIVFICTDQIINSSFVLRTIQI